MSQYEKMSKSRGNVVLPEEVVYGVAELPSNLEFRDIDGEVVDWKFNVWQEPISHFYFTATRYGRKPVFYCIVGNPGTPLIVVDGRKLVQHPDLVDSEGVRYWAEGTPRQVD
jgi:valyl-tRNA synthetase